MSSSNSNNIKKSFNPNTSDDDIAQEVVKKRRDATKNSYSKAIVGATLEVIQKKRNGKPEYKKYNGGLAMVFANTH
ncbi:60S ribosomal protein L24-like protein [Tanacetum coccineum]